MLRAVLVACVLPARAALVDIPPAEPVFSAGASAYMVERDGRLLWSFNADEALPPASLTKLMTALLVVEQGQPGDTVVAISPRAVQATGTRLGLKYGQRYALDQLFTAMLVRSANDACRALAEHAGGGSEAVFVQRMNARARQLGLAQTHFTNACGHHDPAHLSSARDLMALTRVAMAQPRIARTVALQRVVVQSLGGTRRLLESSNHLLRDYEGAVGVKTGYTPEAGPCLIAQARRDGHLVTLVVLNARDRWWQAAAALDRAFAAVAPPLATLPPARPAVVPASPGVPAAPAVPAAPPTAPMPVQPAASTPAPRPVFSTGVPQALPQR